MSMLRDGTTEEHARAERGLFQRALLRGTVPQAVYAAYLSQLLLVHEALEDAIARCPEQSIRRVVTRAQYQVGHLLADLGRVGELHPQEPLPATRSLLETIRGEIDAATLAGFLYVLEGSKNGNAFVARAVRGSLGLEPGSGDLYLDPHGEEQRVVWSEFKNRMDAEGWLMDERRRMLSAAKEMYAAIISISAMLAADLNLNAEPDGARR